jgi:uncharacterized protein YgiM (DUF1202 family)
LLSVVALACNLQAAQPAVVPENTSASAPANTMAATASPEASAAPQQTETAAATVAPTLGPPPVVKIAASGGRLNVRRGPGPEYDTVGSFLDGQSTTATARNADGTWVLINVPNAAKSLGWITLGTKYTSVNGDRLSLPLMQVAPAVPAYIRNCTGRQMLINPMGATLLPRASAPDNQLQFFPGEYSIVDMETEITISNVTVFEGKTIDIKQDSSGKKFSCP